MSGERELLERDLDEGHDPAAEISEEEQRHLVVALRAAWTPGPLDPAALDAIVSGAIGDPDAASVREAEETAAALKSAYAPKPIDPRVNDALVETALFRARRAPRAFRALPIVTIAVTSAVAIAASFVMFFRAGSPPQSAAPTALVRTRSAQELFDPATPFPRHGGETARIDRIKASRAADLRNNRFQTWGVR